MSSLEELVAAHAGLTGTAVDTLQAVVSDWQILADLSFADLVMFCRAPESGELMVVAQMRPYTAQTIYHEDLVGQCFAPEERPAVTRAFAGEGIVRDGDPDWSMGVPVREEAIPVSLVGGAATLGEGPSDPGPQVIAVVTREANLSTVRAPSQLELTYLQIANELSQMLTEGTFPYPEEEPERELAPRVGDGMMRVDPTGVVVYASPNAISAYRRLGVVENVVGSNLSGFDLDADAVLEALADGEPLESEVEARGAVVLRRLLPLTREHRVLGGLILVREVTELRRHERLLLYKDATIREIHHRVKNNLQTVASLLRLQSRRLSSDEARSELWESVRRISSIALVHETLSQDSRQRVSFDKVVERLVEMLGSSLTDRNHPVRMTIEGTAGELAAEVATPLALVVSELVQNSVEHAFPASWWEGGHTSGTIALVLERRAASLNLIVRDDGTGVPEGWSIDGDANLGLRIAATLVESELGGTIEVNRADAEAGTVCETLLPLPR